MSLSPLLRVLLILNRMQSGLVERPYVVDASVVAAALVPAAITNLALVDESQLVPWWGD